MASSVDCHLLGLALHQGARRRGTIMGPEALRTAGLQAALEELGLTCQDAGDVAAPLSPSAAQHSNAALYALPEVAAWTAAISAKAEALADQGGVPVFMGGDHALSAGSVSGMQAAAVKAGKPLFVLWLDAHSDFHTLDTTQSGNLHGTPLAYLTGKPGFEGYFPPMAQPVPQSQVGILGLRSVDREERCALARTDMWIHDMRSIDEHGIVRPLKGFLQRVADAKGWLHVSLDLDFLDPGLAPGVGTPVPGGASEREAHLVMELIHESGLLRSLDLVELNPFLDHAGRSANLLVDLTASLFGRRITDAA